MNPTHPERDEELESLVRWITDKAQAFADDKPVATFPVAEVRKRIAAHTAKEVEAARLDEVTQMLAVGFSYAGKLPKGNYSDKEMVDAYRNLCVAYEKHLTKRTADLTGPKMPDFNAPAPKESDPEQKGKR